MTKREPKSKIEIPTRKTRPKGQGFANLRTPEQVESIPFEELIAPLGTMVPQTTVQETIVPPTMVQQPTVVQTPSEPWYGTTVVQRTTVVWDTIIEHPEQWTAQPNEISDKVLGLLDVYEQTVLQRLYRLSCGYQSETCKVGFEKLAKACNISKKKAQTTIDRLESKGLIERVHRDLGNKIKQERGNVYRIRLPAAKMESRTKVQRTMVQPTMVQDASYKYNNKEKDIKGDSAPPDYKNCPDCQGSGFFYPKGFEGGVAKCKHERLGK
jgi:predicted transcriptional regulator